VEIRIYLWGCGCPNYVSALPIKTNANKKLAPLSGGDYFPPKAKLIPTKYLKLFWLLDAFGMWLEPKWVYR